MISLAPFRVFEHYLSLTSSLCHQLSIANLQETNGNLSEQEGKGQITNDYLISVWL